MTNRAHGHYLSEGDGNAPEYPTKGKVDMEGQLTLSASSGSPNCHQVCNGRENERN